MIEPHDMLAAARRLLACLLPTARAEAGDTLIEVVVSAALLGLIVVGVLGALDSGQRTSADQRRHAQADQLAEQDQDRLRGLRIVDLTNLMANPSSGVQTVTLDNTPYTVTSTAAFVSASTGTGSCTSGGSGTADYVKASSVVTWPTMRMRLPVEEDTVIAPPAGGALVVSVSDQSANPVSGVNVAVTGTGAGTTPSETTTTGTEGCATFAGLADGSYTVAINRVGYIDQTGSSAPQKPETVVSGQTTTAAFQYAQAATLTVNYLTTVGSPAVQIADNFDTFVAADNLAPTPLPGGTAGTYTSSASISAFPFTQAYSVYGGSCAANNPSIVNSANTTPSAALTPGATTTVAIDLPPMLIRDNDRSGRAMTIAPTDATVTDIDTGCNGVVRRYAGSQVSLPSGSTGALTYPGEPYGRFAVCTDFNLSTTQASAIGFSAAGWYYGSATASNATATGTTATVSVSSAGRCP